MAGRRLEVHFEAENQVVDRLVAENRSADLAGNRLAAQAAVAGNQLLLDRLVVGIRQGVRLVVVDNRQVVRVGSRLEAVTWQGRRLEDGKEAGALLAVGLSQP